MIANPFISFEVIDDAQLSKVRHTFGLLEAQLHPEERDETAPGYRLGWYERMQARECHREDVAQFRHFVDEMCERALKRASRTEALFPSLPAGPANAEGSEFNVLRARQLCESFCAEIGKSA